MAKSMFRDLKLDLGLCHSKPAIDCCTKKKRKKNDWNQNN